MKKVILGIDEAGRGAVIGPLVVAGVVIAQNQRRFLRMLGVKDSKKLTPQKREEIFKTFQTKNIQFYFVEISPFKIDRNSINELEIEAAVKIAKKVLNKRVRLLKVFLDVPAFGKGIDRYCQKISEKINKFVSRRVEIETKEVEVWGGNRLDDRNVVVSAASIVAKVIRDNKIERLKKEYGDFGSGYPNEQTITFLRANYEKLKPIVRHKWYTIEKIKAQREKRKTTT